MRCNLLLVSVSCLSMFYCSPFSLRAALTPFLAHEVQPFASQRALLIGVMLYSIVSCLLMIFLGCLCYRGLPVLESYVSCLACMSQTCLEAAQAA